MSERRAAPATFLLLLLVLGLLGMDLLLDHRGSGTPPATSQPTATPEPSRSPRPVIILFTSAHGTGRLTLLTYRWASSGRAELRLQVELTCITGSVEHGPASFALVDGAGAEYRPAGAGFPQGRLARGEQVGGELVFVLGEQPVTLVFSDEAGSVTALRVPG